jgi:hypothetical protein
LLRSLSASSQARCAEWRRSARSTLARNLMCKSTRRSGSKGEDAVVEKFNPGQGEGRHPLQEFDGLKEEVRGAIAPHRLEFRRGRALGAGGGPGPAGGAEEIAAELLEGGPVGWGTQGLACRSKPSRWARCGSLVEVRCKRSGPSLRRRTRAPALGSGRRARRGRRSRARPRRPRSQ